jgi:hypothetical protein
MHELSDLTLPRRILFHRVTCIYNTTKTYDWLITTVHSSINNKQIRLINPMRSMPPGGTREGSCVLSLGDLFLEMSHFYKCHVYSTCSAFGYSWPLSSCYSLECVCHQVFCLPVLLLPILASHADVPWVHLHQSTLATRPPHFQLRLKATATMSYVLVPFLTSVFFTQSLHTTCSFLCSIFYWQLWSIFSFSMSDIQVTLVKLDRKRQGMITSVCQLLKKDSDPHKWLNNLII